METAGQTLFSCDYHQLFCYGTSSCRLNNVIIYIKYIIYIIAHDYERNYEYLTTNGGHCS